MKNNSIIKYGGEIHASTARVAIVCALLSMARPAFCQLAPIAQLIKMEREEARPAKAAANAKADEIAQSDRELAETQAQIKALEAKIRSLEAAKTPGGKNAGQTEGANSNARTPQKAPQTPEGGKNAVWRRRAESVARCQAMAERLKESKDKNAAQGLFFSAYGTLEGLMADVKTVRESALFIQSIKSQLINSRTQGEMANIIKANHGKLLKIGVDMDDSLLTLTLSAQQFNEARRPDGIGGGKANAMSEIEAKEHEIRRQQTLIMECERMLAEISAGNTTDWGYATKDGVKFGNSKVWGTNRGNARRGWFEYRSYGGNANKGVTPPNSAELKKYGMMSMKQLIDHGHRNAISRIAENARSNLGRVRQDLRAIKARAADAKKKQAAQERRDYANAKTNIQKKSVLVGDLLDDAIKAMNECTEGLRAAHETAVEQTAALLSIVDECFFADAGLKSVLTAQKLQMLQSAEELVVEAGL